MNSTSDISHRTARLLAALAALLALGACIQGPWDYYPKNPPPYRGVFVTGYAIAGRPLTNVCFERVLDLSEEETEAFPFYDSAQVTVNGSFGGAVKTLTLSPRADTANCFSGDSLTLVEKGHDYDLRARIVWDSAGHRVTSVITGTAHVPTLFSIHDSASAPSLAKNGGVPDRLFTRDTSLKAVDQIKAIEDFIPNLPEHVRPLVQGKYTDTLARLEKDSNAADAFLRKNGKVLQGLLFNLLEADRFNYPEGATLYYLNGEFNTLSHYFSSTRSADVKAVLITQRFDPDSARPETRFDSPLGIKPDSARYYFPGNHRRLLIYPDAKGSKGYNLLDSMGVVNTWFTTGLNRFYFYGVEQAYMAFHASATQVQGGGGASDGDPRVKPKYNVTGGIGIFIGAVVDSFDLNIVTDPLTKSYSLPAVHAAFCREDGWQASQDCRGYYRSYCSGRNWAPGDNGECLDDAVAVCLEAGRVKDTVTEARCKPSADSAARAGGLIAVAGAQRYCIENDFPADGPDCSWAQALCAAGGANGCKDELWTFCKDNLWKPAQCGPGLVSYCKDKGRPSEILCSNADDFCRAHPAEAVCK